MAGAPVAPLAAEEAQFVADVAAGTGLDPRVVVTWIQAEGAYAPNGTGGHNWLNMRPYGSDVGVVGQSRGGFDQFASERDAAISTIRRIQQPFLWTSPSLGGPGLGQVVAAHGSPAAEMSAIGRSGWDAGHYQSGGPPGAALQSIFDRIFGAGAAGGKPQPPSPAIAAAAVTASGQGLPSLPKQPGLVGTYKQGVGDVAGAAGAVAHDIASPFELAKRVFDFVFSARGLEVGGGFLLVILGVLWLARRQLPGSVTPGGAGVAS